MYSTPNSRQGFTLIELSIILVIIGLIIGGILVGREMIKTSEIRNMISDVERFKTAVNTFKIKYQYLPGDLPYPELFFDTTGWDSQYTGAYVHAGSTAGNGMVEYLLETGKAFVQLSFAQLIKGVGMIKPTTYPAASYASCGVNQPKGALGNGCYQIINQVTNKANTGQYNWITYGSMRTNGTWQFFANNAALSSADAYAIDSKADDGKPLAGKTITTLSEGSNPDIVAAATTQTGIPWYNFCNSDDHLAYLSATVNYQLNYDYVLCRMAFRID